MTMAIIGRPCGSAAATALRCQVGSSCGSGWPAAGSIASTSSGGSGSRSASAGHCDGSTADGGGWGSTNAGACDGSTVGAFGTSTANGAAALILLAIWRRTGADASVDWLAWFDRRVLLLELFVLILFLVSLGPVARVFVGWWGLLLLVGVVGVGILAPLLLELRDRARSEHHLARGAALVLFGGFVLRVVVLLSSNGIHVLGSGVAGQ